MNLNVQTQLNLVTDAIDTAKANGYEPSPAVVDALAALDAVNASTMAEPAPLAPFALTLGAKTKPATITELLTEHANHAAHRAEFDAARAELAELAARRIIGCREYGPVLTTLGERFLEVAAEFTDAVRDVPAATDATSIVNAGSAALAAFERARSAKAEMDELRRHHGTLSSLTSPGKDDLATMFCTFSTPANADALAEGVRDAQHYPAELSPWREMYAAGVPAWRGITEARQIAAGLPAPAIDGFARGRKVGALR